MTLNALSHRHSAYKSGTVQALEDSLSDRVQDNQQCLVSGILAIRTQFACKEILQTSRAASLHVAGRRFYSFHKHVPIDTGFMRGGRTRLRFRH